MKTRKMALASVLAAVSATGWAVAASRNGFAVSVLVDGLTRPEIRHRGTVYVEALRDKAYTLRLVNPTGVRVAVALAVDGLNTIDARHTDARSAAKWVLEPYGTLDIAGWQVSGGEARRFVFTTETASYGAWLGSTANLGVIEAAFFRERVPAVPVTGGEAAERQLVPRESAKKLEAPQALSESAATGIGERVEHRVRRVHLELEEEPAAVVRIRYEFRPQLEALGVLPRAEGEDPLARRERARGFEPYCPDPGRRW